MDKPMLLLADDEEGLRSMLQAALHYKGFEVHAVSDGRAALEQASRRHFDLILLDVMMPDLDGFEVCRRLRSQGLKAPIIFLTARDETSDRVQGLTIGGDDYLVKPFSLEELVARIEVVLRRCGTTGAASSILTCEDLRLDQDAHLVHRGDVELLLSPTEFNLLRFLLANQGKVLSKSQILNHVWNFDFGGESGVVETYIGYLRKKVDTVEPKLIHTVRGVGYTLRPQPR